MRCSQDTPVAQSAGSEPKTDDSQDLHIQKEQHPKHRFSRHYAEEPPANHQIFPDDHPHKQPTSSSSHSSRAQDIKSPCSSSPHSVRRHEARHANNHLTSFERQVRLIGNRFPVLRGVGPEFEARSWKLAFPWLDAGGSGFKSQARGISGCVARIDSKEMTPEES